MKVLDQNLLCHACKKPCNVSDDSGKDQILLTKCQHLFHDKCLKDGLLANVDLTAPNITRQKHETECPIEGCEEEITHKLKAVGTGAAKTYEVIKIEDVSVADTKVLEQLVKDAEDVPPTDDEKQAFKNATMTLGAVFVAALAGVLFHNVIAIAVGAAVGYGACYVGSKAIDFISTFDFNYPKELLASAYNYLFTPDSALEDPAP